MARITSVGMGRKKFVASAAEEAQAKTATDPQQQQVEKADKPANAESSSKPKPKAGGTEPAAKKKRRGRERTKDETGKRVAIGEKKGADDGKKPWGRDANVARKLVIGRANLSSKHAEDRIKRRAEQKNMNVTCFACRSMGHAARDCPNILLAATTVGAPVEGQESEAPQNEVKSSRRKGGKKGGDVTTGKCYRCNSTEHGLFQCTEPVDPTNPTPFATCYICLASGHLASLCPNNTKGVYVNGGECKVCKSTAHRAKDCPDDKREKVKDDGEQRRGRFDVVLGVGQGAGADEDDFMVEARHRPAERPTKNKRHAPARNSERPMKRMREVGDEGPVYAEQGEIVRQPDEAVPLTGRKKVEGVKKAKVKAVAF
ncbi:zinc knuckle family protein [Cryptococcus wingfieldii CBS 7118]|uniref:Zinc knuckle family protein n=1 Tax=Cryptococcus wingfieldii CBS 7118 TaxID=1295528 RepID=A0A1E3JBY4_9TREE|nr:zinc knuckle family protein [Cryptococcus wingfieldii CBS 7118]ODN98352.1 zinc knuckle family protein [Cryptococcus wingfieldii CBS 7118]